MTSRSTQDERDDVTALIEGVRDDGASRVFLAATGAGAGIQKRVWDVPGVSSFFVGAAFPYAAEETCTLLGFAPTSFCSEETAIDLAMASFMRAAASGSGRPIGIGLTAAVASREARRGDHRAYAAYFSDEGAAVAHVVLPKEGGEDARRRDGDACDRLGLAAIAAASGKAFEGAAFTRRDDVAQARLFAHPFFRASGARTVTEALPEDVALFPGAFNPPHEGHLGGAVAVTRASGRSVVFATTIDPPHKPALTTAEVLRRAVLMRGHDVLFTAGDPLYLDKARRFPGRAFIIGADAFVRMLDPKWGPDVPALVAELAALGARFFVIPRLIEGQIVGLDDIRARGDLAHALGVLDVHPVQGRWDISSSELRAHAARG